MECINCGPLDKDDFTNYQLKQNRKRCRQCVRSASKRHYKLHPEKYRENEQKALGRARKLIFEYLKTHTCVDCGESDVVVLEFDHLKNKKYNIATIMNHGSLQKLKEEIKKCEVVCCNCHRRRTSKRQFSWRLAAIV